MKNLLFVLIILISGAAFAETTHVITAKVKGMVCGNCVENIRTSAEKNENVLSAKVDLSAGEVVFNLKPGSELTDDEIKELVGKAGYHVSEINRDAPDA